jgi:ABC-2 type transport system permease protein
VLLVVSGVYYPIDVLPGWMQSIAAISPATYALDGVRAAILDGAGLTSMGRELLLLAVIGLVCIPVGLALFAAGERYAKRNGKLKRSG